MRKIQVSTRPGSKLSAALAIMLGVFSGQETVPSRRKKQSRRLVRPQADHHGHRTLSKYKPHYGKNAAARNLCRSW